DTDDLFVGKTLLHGDVLMWLMKTLLTSVCINQRGAGHVALATARRASIEDAQRTNNRDLAGVVDVPALVPPSATRTRCNTASEADGHSCRCSMARHYSAEVLRICHLMIAECVGAVA
ncbi:hypothetical protein, partial [Serratia marcescens]